MGIIERKEREKEQRRNEIIDAAEKVFFDKGVDNATMDAVAEIAELSKGTLYLYFKNKEDLHFAICMRGLTILKQELENVISPQRTIIENLIHVGFAFVKFARINADYFKVLSHFEGKSNEECHVEHKHTEKDEVMELLVNLIEKGIEEGTIRKEINPNVVAHILWAQTTGVLQLMSVKKFHLDLNKITDDDFIMAHFEVVANGIRAGEASLDIKKYFN